MEKNLVLIRGAGDLASGVALRLSNCGFRVIMLELSSPSSIRRTVCFSQAIYEGRIEIEGKIGLKADDFSDALEIAESGKVAILIDENAECIESLRPDIIIDAMMAKKNLGTKIGQAELVIALGPGFEANVDADYVIETKRGHYLGKIISSGTAIADTGTPGIIGGFGKERVVHSSAIGKFKSLKQIGQSVFKDEPLATIGTIEQKSKIDGVVRGMLNDDFYVPSVGFKIADVDPRSESASYIHSVSDKARAIAGGVLECILSHRLKDELSGRLTKNEFSSTQPLQKRRNKPKKANPEIQIREDVIKNVDSVIAYTDGSYNVQSHSYSYGALILFGDSVYEMFKSFPQDENSQFRNVAGELMGSMAVMQYCLDNNIASVEIHYDYQGIESWCTGEWKAKNEFTQGYKKYFDSISDKLKIKFVKVKAHSGEKYNQRVDELAAFALSLQNTKTEE